MYGYKTLILQEDDDGTPEVNEGAASFDEELWVLCFVQNNINYFTVKLISFVYC